MTDSEAVPAAALTEEELLKLPAAVSISVANRAFGLGRSMGYDLAKRGQYPCKVLRVGQSYRVVTADLLRVLEISPQRVDGEGAGVKPGSGLGLVA